MSRGVKPGAERDRHAERNQSDGHQNSKSFHKETTFEHTISEKTQPGARGLHEGMDSRSDGEAEGRRGSPKLTHGAGANGAMST